MQKSPSVTVITPSTRPHMLEKCITGFLSQDYKGKMEMIIVSDDKIEIGNCPKNIHVYQSKLSISHKLNYACSIAKGDIILRMDDDDYYCPSWVKASVSFLQSSGAALTGLCSAYFYQPGKALYDYDYRGQQAYVLGATMCFWKETWEKSKKKFYSNNPKGIGEDKNFCVNNGIVHAHDNKYGFMALVHGSNTSSHDVVNNGYAKQIDISNIKNIVGYAERQP